MTIPYPISDPNKPVEIWARGGEKFAKRLPNMKAFYDWYKPNTHGYMGARETKKDIVLFLESAEDVAATKKLPPLSALSRKGPRGTPQQVSVNGNIYRSVREAFKALGLPDSKHVKFRTELKAKLVATFNDYEFRIVQ